MGSRDTQLKPADCGCGRWVFDHIRVRQIQKTAGGFIFEDDGLREQAVAEAVAEEFRWSSSVMGRLERAPVVVKAEDISAAD